MVSGLFLSECHLRLQLFCSAAFSSSARQLATGPSLSPAAGKHLCSGSPGPKEPRQASAAELRLKKVDIEACLKHSSSIHVFGHQVYTAESEFDVFMRRQKVEAGWVNIVLPLFGQCG